MEYFVNRIYLFQKYFKRIGRSQKLDDLAQQQVQKIDGMDQIAGANTDLTQLSGMEAPRSEEEIRKELIEKTKDIATDVIAAQQPKIDAAMKKFRKYSHKFSNIPSMDSLPKRAPNPMKELHWRERIVPGLVTQSLTLDKFYFQIDPHVCYKLNGRFSLGVGGMYRFSMNAAKLQFGNFGALTGEKVFIQSRIYKGFYLQAEGQKLQWKTFRIPPSNDPNHWDSGIAALAGIGKDYSIGKKIKGNMQTLYHFYWGEQDPCNSKIMIRFGIDFSIKKKEVKPWEEKLKQLRHAKRKGPEVK